LCSIERVLVTTTRSSGHLIGLSGNTECKTSCHYVMNRQRRVNSMTTTSWTEICVSDFEQSITWFENVLGFRVEARDANEYAEMIISVNPATYHSQVAAAFQRDATRIIEELATVKETADALARQQDYLGAATIYETLVTEIFEESHLYYDEEEESEDNDYYEE